MRVGANAHPASSSPSATGSVSSKTASEVKLRMANESIERSGEGCRAPPGSMCWMESRRANMVLL